MTTHTNIYRGSRQTFLHGPVVIVNKINLVRAESALHSTGLRYRRVFGPDGKTYLSFQYEEDLERAIGAIAPVVVPELESETQSRYLLDAELYFQHWEASGSGSAYVYSWLALFEMQEAD